MTYAAWAATAGGSGLSAKAMEDRATQAVSAAKIVFFKDMIHASLEHKLQMITADF